MREQTEQLLATGPVDVPTLLKSQESTSMLQSTDLQTHLLNAQPHDGFTFVVGSALCAPIIPNVEGFVNLVRAKVRGYKTATRLDKELARKGVNRYQVAIEYLAKELGQGAVDHLIFEGVIGAIDQNKTFHLSSSEWSNGNLNRLPEEIIQAWTLTPAVESLGKLVVRYGERFGKDVLTTNFDPLIEVSIRRAGGDYVRLGLDGDSSLHATTATVCRVIHLHGYWHSVGTLHTPAQLRLPRPNLQRSLEQLLRDRTVIVMGYGGWDDIFMTALAQTVNKGFGGKLFWCFYSDLESEIEHSHDHVLRQLLPGLEHGNVKLVKGVDIQRFLPQLTESLEKKEALASTMRKYLLYDLIKLNMEETSKFMTVIDQTMPDWRLQTASEYDVTLKKLETITNGFQEADLEAQVEQLIDYLSKARYKNRDLLHGMHETVRGGGISEKQLKDSQLQSLAIFKKRKVSSEDQITIKNGLATFCKYQLEQCQGPFYDVVGKRISKASKTIDPNKIADILRNVEEIYKICKLTANEADVVWNSMATSFAYQIQTRNGDFWQEVQQAFVG